MPFRWFFPMVPSQSEPSKDKPKETHERSHALRDRKGIWCGFCDSVRCDWSNPFGVVLRDSIVKAFCRNNFIAVCTRLTDYYRWIIYLPNFIKLFPLDGTIFIQMLNSLTHSIKYKRMEKYQRGFDSRSIQKRARLVFLQSPSTRFLCEKKSQRKKKLEPIESPNSN